MLRIHLLNTYRCLVTDTDNLMATLTVAFGVPNQVLTKRVSQSPCVAETDRIRSRSPLDTTVRWMPVRNTGEHLALRGLP